jgi:predicted methyltransferase
MNMVIDQIIRDFFQYLNSATDIEKAKQTVNITLYELNVNRIEEIKSSSFFWIERTVDSTVESTLTCVEKHLGLI